jgi:hypothetical protein
VEKWLNSIVVACNLCPFAGRELRAGRVRYVVTPATQEVQLLEALAAELQLLSDDSTIATTLLIHPRLLQRFDDYNQFLDQADRLLVQLDYEGIYQIAGFHPDFQFAGTRPDDAENYSSRSPYPLLHLLREASIDRAVAEYPDIDGIPARNINTLNAIGSEELQALWQACFRQ